MQLYFLRRQTDKQTANAFPTRGASRRVGLLPTYCFSAYYIPYYCLLLPTYCLADAQIALLSFPHCAANRGLLWPQGPPSTKNPHATVTHIICAPSTNYDIRRSFYLPLIRSLVMPMPSLMKVLGFTASFLSQSVGYR